MILITFIKRLNKKDGKFETYCKLIDLLPYKK